MLRRRDPALAPWISHHGDLAPNRRIPAFERLCGAILSQQISTSAAATIKGRFMAAVGHDLSARRVLALDGEQLRACGISRQKASYLLDLARRVHEGSLRPSQLWRLEDEAAIEAITAVRGLGVWSAQMFLIFGLGRPDVMAVDDLGLQNAIRHLDSLRARPSRVDFLARAERWRPWRSLASLHLWAGLEDRPVA